MELIKHYYSYLHFIHISLKERAFKYQARSFVIKIVDNIFIDTVAIKIKLANLSFEQLSNQPQGKKKQQNERFYEIFIAKKKKKERKLTDGREEKKRKREEKEFKFENLRVPFLF